MALIFFFWGGLMAQQSSVAGTATDDSGLPLPGATVVVENTNRGVTTDFDGNFSINAQNGEVLIVSYVGYQNSRITVGNQSNYNISLQTSITLNGFGECHNQVIKPHIIILLLMLLPTTMPIAILEHILMKIL